MNFKLNFSSSEILIKDVVKLKVFVFVLAAFCMVRALPSSKQEWKITFYTGERIWAGTDSDIYIQLHGNLGNSPIISLNAQKNQMESNSIDTFPLDNLDQTKFGNIRSITIGKQHSYAFFNDWQLIKAEIVDPLGVKYLFNCECWLTTLKFKRTLELTSIDGVEQEQGSSVSDLFSVSHAKTSRVFPMTIGLLFLFLIIIIFTYFGNILCKKWRESSHYLFMSARSRLGYEDDANNQSGWQNRSRRRTNQNRSSLTSAGIDLNLPENRGNNNLVKDDDDDEFVNRHRVYNYTNNLENVNANYNLNRSNHHDRFKNSSILQEDKPPEYKELFPLKNLNTSKSKETNSEIEAIVTSNVTETQSNACQTTETRETNNTANSTSV